MTKIIITMYICAVKNPKPSMPFYYDADVRGLLLKHKKKTGATATFVLNEAARQYFKKLKTK